MAIINVGTITVDMNTRGVNPFPAVNLASGVGYVFILRTVPTNLVVQFAYFVVCPFVLIGGLAYEISCQYKWYPKGAFYSFVVPVYQAGGANLDIVMSVLPIEIFKGRSIPNSIDVECSYEDTFTQPLGFG